MRIVGVVWWLVLSIAAAVAQSPRASAPEQIIIDTDIGDDVDDAFAVALALRSPELQILGITTGFGDTETRAKLVDGATQSLDSTLRHLIDHNCRLLLQSHFDEGASRAWILQMIQHGQESHDQ